MQFSSDYLYILISEKNYPPDYIIILLIMKKLKNTYFILRPIYNIDSKVVIRIDTFSITNCIRPPQYLYYFKLILNTLLTVYYSTV